jgi:glyoxylase-like metal-dependent hydrolase (beta-lactamase superfamily II)
VNFAAPLAAAFTLFAPQAPAVCDLLGFTPVRVSPHVMLFQTPEGTPGIVNGNTVAVIGRDAVLVLDPGQFPTEAERVLAEIRRTTKAPVKYIVNSHWHGDHVVANSVYRDAFPDAKVIAHPFTIAKAAETFTPDYVEKTRRGIHDATGFYRKKLETAPEDERTWINATFECMEPYLKELPRSRFVAADTPVEKQLDLDLGGVVASVRHLGTGNTPGDLVVWVPADRVVATGDIVVHPAPYAIGSDLAPWPATIDAMLALAPAVFMPGHGPPLRDDRYVRDLRALIAATQLSMEVLKAQGATKEEAIAQLDPDGFREKYIHTPMQRQAFDKFFVRSAVAAYW